DWQPERGAGLYAFWRDTLAHDPGIGTLMGLPQLHRQLDQLPATPDLAIRWVMEKVDLPSAVWPDYLEALLLNINGWASWCAYLDWQARQAGGRDHSLRELLAVRLAWGAILLNPALIPGVDAGVRTLREIWQEAPAKLAAAQSAFAVDEVWQLALDLAYQGRLARQLSARAAGNAAMPGKRGVQVQAVFCIDVRSEPLRRALEAHDPHVQTIGFAGFFGLPISYKPIGTAASSPRLPGLLPPAVEAGDSLPASAGADVPGAAAVQRARQRHFSIAEQWRAASRWPAAAFSYVEAFGWSYSDALRNWLKIKPQNRERDDLDGLPKRYRHLCRPSLDRLDAAARAAIAARILRLMGLDHDLAPLVLLVGHGSQSANNPQAAALECGACGGQSGEVNARILARMLNDADVREQLVALGIQVPAHTVFAAALHNTTTDELEWFDLDLLPAFSQANVARLQATFDAALDQVRRERAPQLQIDATQQPAHLLRALKRRASDGAQTRPEWGLANNAAFIIAPRELTRDVDLAGRSFLHDYDASRDGDGSKLEQLMTAPMLVTHWINWQYHASSCEPVYFGSGNKLLHNVVGAHIGVFEGNGGDLRIGLSRQSLHDGERDMHEPLRLSVVIAAPHQRIEAVLHKHAHLRALVDNDWMYLCLYEIVILERYRWGQWLGYHDMDEIAYVQEVLLVTCC
ncbi:MAG: YbcC family protein, partial [Nocardioides sp.]